jgi:hypothetical protein
MRYTPTDRAALPHRTPVGVGRVDATQGYCAPVRLTRDPDVMAEEPTAGETWARRYRDDLLWGAVVSVVVLVAFVVPHLHLRWLTPLVTHDPGQYRSLAGTAPVLGQWLPHGNTSTACAVVIALAVVARGPSLARRLSWRPLVLLSWICALAWTLSLTFIDGVQQGFVGRMDGAGGYLAQIPRAGGVSGLLHGFAAHIPATSAGPWDLSIAGDPAGALLTFFGLDRLGLGGPAWAATLCVVAGSSAAAAVLVAVRALADEPTARRVAPFVALAPLAVWVGVSADAYFAAVGAWGLALLTVAATGSSRYPVPVAMAGGAVLGFSVYLDYGAVLLAVPVVAVLLVAAGHRPPVGSVLRAVVGGAAGALAVAVAFTAMGFWWFDGLSLVRHRYAVGIAMARPYSYWVWANLASLTCAIGLAAATGLRRAFDLRALRDRSGLHVLLVAFVVVVAVADLSGLSKAETERIWLPYAVWLVAAPALLPRGSHRFCLGVQAVGALLVNSLLLTTW